MGESETIWIPKEQLWKCRTRVQAMLLIHACADWEGPDWAPVDAEALARELCTSKRSIEAALKALERIGAIERQFFHSQHLRGGVRLAQSLRYAHNA